MVTAESKTFIVAQNAKGKTAHIRWRMYPDLTSLAGGLGHRSLPSESRIAQGWVTEGA
jgi:hypothetical protein